MNKLVAIAPIILVALCLLMVSPVQSVSAKKMTASEFAKLPGSAIPFSCTDAAGTNCHDDVISNAPAVSNSKAESASSADSQNNVKCFAFCLGISNANSGSAADSNSRTNSPGNTASVLPVSPRSTTTTVAPLPPVTFPMPNPAATAGIQCLDISGSVQDQGYAKGYVDGNRDSAGLNGHGYDASLHGNHTPEFRQGYQDGYRAGWNDGVQGINQNPC